MKPLLTIALAGALLAGCVGSPADDPAAGATAPRDNATGDTATANLTFEGATPPAAPRVVPIAFDGKIPAYAEACAFALVTGQCVAAPPTADFTTLRTEVETDGVPTAGTVVATWTPASPAHQELFAFAFATSGDRFADLGWAMGASPLALELDFSEMSPGDTIYMGLAPPGRSVDGPVAVWTSASPAEQAFHLAGQLTVPG